MSYQQNPANTRHPSYTTRTFTIPAGETVKTFRDADFVTCLVGDAKFKIAFDNGPAVDFEQGLTYRTRDGFRDLDITNPTGAAIVVTIGMGRGDVQDSRLSLTGTIGADVVAPAVFDAGAPVSAPTAAATLLLASDGNRREALIVNAGAATVYIGGSAAAAAGEGLPLVGGQALTLATSAALYVRNDSGGPIDIHAGSMGVL